MQISVGYSRKISPEQYGARETSAYVTLTPEDGIVLSSKTLGDLPVLLQDLTNSCVANVCERLELPYESVDGVVREIGPAAARLAQATGGVAAPKTRLQATEPLETAASQPPAPQAGPPPAAPQTAVQPVPNAYHPPAGQIPTTGDERKDVVIREINANPDVWEDKRHSKTNPKAPDFVHRFESDAKNPKFKRGAWVR